MYLDNSSQHSVKDLLQTHTALRRLDSLNPVLSDHNVDQVWALYEGKLGMVHIPLLFYIYLFLHSQVNSHRGDL